MMSIEHEMNLKLLTPALALLPRQLDTPRARVMLLAIGLQESRFVHRYQIVEGKPLAKGPARGLWQFERGGGCRGVITHKASRYWMHMVCELRGVAFTSEGVWRALETDDVLACCAARLLLFTDPYTLPDVSEKTKAWGLYLSVWQPGKPKPETWPEFHARARKEISP